MRRGGGGVRDLEVVRGLLGALRAGEPRTAGGLGLVPVFGGRAAAGYRLAEEAIAAGLLEVGELGGGVVPELVVRNGAPEPVLLLEGEHLVGAKQDRVLNVSVLVPASSELPIPVSCVEAGRWAYRSERRFGVERTFATPDVRRAKTRSVAARQRRVGDRRSDQHAVWDAVAMRLAASGTGSPTASLRDAFVDRAKELDRILEEAGEPLPEQTGVLACVGGRPVALDVLDRPETLARLWPRLIRAYALDALGAQEAEVGEEEVERFVGRLREAEVTAHDAVGLGTEVVLTAPGLAGSALVWEAAVVHLAAFADPGNADAEADPRSRTAAAIPLERGSEWRRRAGASADRSGSAPRSSGRGRSLR